MPRRVIVVGDTLSSGGEVIEGADTDNIDGHRIARKGDLVRCAAHDVNPIAECDETWIVQGCPPAGA